MFGLIEGYYPWLGEQSYCFFLFSRIFCKQILLLFCYIQENIEILKSKINKNTYAESYYKNSEFERRNT